MNDAITINGYTVSIWAEKLKEGYFAHWACECGETGGSNYLDKRKKIVWLLPNYMQMPMLLLLTRHPNDI